MNEPRHQGVSVEEPRRTERLQQAVQLSYPGLQMREGIYDHLSFDGTHLIGNGNALSV